jgi:hypothetical protein
MTQTYEDMKYNELKALCATNGLNASGTKEDLIARLSDGTHLSEKNDQPQQETPVADDDDRPAVKLTAEQLHMTKAMKQKAYLDKQKKVSVMIPFEQGENPEQAKKIPFHVGINGYSIEIPRGVFTEVPEDVAKIVRERLESEGRIGRDHLIDSDPKRQEALS